MSIRLNRIILNKPKYVRWVCTVCGHQLIPGKVTAVYCTCDDSHYNTALQQMEDGHVYSSNSVQPGSSRKEGPAESLLHTARMDQSVTDAALQSRQGVLQGV